MYFKEITEKPESLKIATEMSLDKWRKIFGFCESKKFPDGFDPQDFYYQACPLCAFFRTFAPDRSDNTDNCPLNKRCEGRCCADWRKFGDGYDYYIWPTLVKHAAAIVRKLEQALEEMQ